MFLVVHILCLHNVIATSFGELQNTIAERNVILINSAIIDTSVVLDIVLHGF